jgi:acyl-CoA synthetase (NDP forming)
VSAGARAEVAGRLRAAGRPLTEVEAKELLAVYGIAPPPEVLARDETEAVAAAARIGEPVALKVQSPAIRHKTEVGALALSLASADAVRAAWRRLTASVATTVPGAEIQGILVQRMAPSGREVIVGVTRDAVFGPMLMVGLGGVWVEVLRDVALAPVPVDRDGAVELVRRLRGAALLHGARGEPPADLEALADLLVRVSRFAADHAELIDEVDLNPVIVHPAGQGLTVVDALIVPRRNP